MGFVFFLASESAYRKIAWFLSKFQTWLGQKTLVFAHIVDFLECLLFSNYTETVLLDRHQVLQSHDLMSSDILWKKKFIPPFFKKTQLFVVRIYFFHNHIF